MGQQGSDSSQKCKIHVHKGSPGITQYREHTAHTAVLFGSVQCPTGFFLKHTKSQSADLQSATGYSLWTLRMCSGQYKQLSQAWILWWKVSPLLNYQQWLWHADPPTSKAQWEKPCVLYTEVAHSCLTDLYFLLYAFSTLLKGLRKEAAHSSFWGSSSKSKSELVESGKPLTASMGNYPTD